MMHTILQQAINDAMAMGSTVRLRRPMDVKSPPLPPTTSVRSSPLGRRILTHSNPSRPSVSYREGAARLEDWELPPIDLRAVFPAGRLASAKARAFADFAGSIVATQSTLSRMTDVSSSRR
jgi:hypothetical protein